MKSSIIIMYNNGSTDVSLLRKERCLKYVVANEILSKSVDKTNHPVQLKDKKKYKVKNQKRVKKN